MIDNDTFVLTSLAFVAGCTVGLTVGAIIGMGALGW